MKTIKHYVDKIGNSLGDFEGSVPKDGIEVPTRPSTGLDIWKGGEWNAANPTQSVINDQSLDYLKSTDWYVVRMSETNVKVPDKILKARAAARVAIKEI
tara:strand:- start:50 stop:346 length:297 start_codon:yes stop_codon:yes gene_type:complete